MKRAWVAGTAVAFAVVSAGCSSLLAEGGAAGAGIAGGALASAVTDNAGVAAGIGIGMQAATRAGIQYGQRKIHGEAQQQIARVAGPLKSGQVSDWHTVHALPLEPEEAGRVAVSRVISTGELDCKEIVFSVDRSAGEKLPASAFYIASICRSGGRWDWASAEPATARWGSLQ